jgi:hypothetical protein
MMSGYFLPREAVAHSLAGLPHWTTRCPKDATAILVIGQSQASNTGPRRHISFSASRAFADSQCYYLRDPMPGTAGRGGTVWPEFADKIGKRLVIEDIAISGSAIEEWTAPDQLRRFKTAITQLHAAGYPNPIIILMQGETNTATHTTAASYYQSLHSLLEVAPKNDWIITRESVCYARQRKWVPLDIARDRIAREFPNVTIGPDLDQIGIALRQPDHCHMTPEGQTLLAGELSASARGLMQRAAYRTQ